MPSLPSSTIDPKKGKKHWAWIGLGANLGNKQQTLQNAVKSISQLPCVELEQTSSLYLTAPIETTGPFFLNAVIRVNTVLTPHELLKELQILEDLSGRQRTYRNAPRTLDLDLLLYDDITVDSDFLCIPHPRMTHRAFVVKPLAEINPELVPDSWQEQCSLQAIKYIASAEEWLV